MKKLQAGGQYDWNNPIWGLLPNNMLQNIQSLYSNYNTGVTNNINNNINNSAAGVPDISYYEKRYRDIYKDSKLFQKTDDEIRKLAEDARQREIDKNASPYKNQLNDHNTLMSSGVIPSMIGLYQGQKGYMKYLSREKQDLTPEMGFHGFKHGGYINKTGYTPGTLSMGNPFNIIPSQNITMQRTPFNVFGISDNGISKVMEPGKDYKFPGAKYVTEIPMHQEGGYTEPTPVQTEEGEFIALTDGTIIPVKAKKKHKNMDDDEVTDLLPKDAFVFAKHKNSTIYKNKKLKGEDLNELVIGYTPTEYSETEDFSSPKEIKALDFMNKNKFTPADLASKLRRTYKVTDRENDAFATHAIGENKQSRIPYIELIKNLNEMKKSKNVKKFQDGGIVDDNDYDYYDKYEKENRRSSRILTEKGDPYEYMISPDGDYFTRKKSGGKSWIALNKAGIIEVEKRLAAGRYDGNSYKSKKEPSPARKVKEDYGPVNLPEVVVRSSKNDSKYNYTVNSENNTYIPQVYPEKYNNSKYQYTVTDENIQGGDYFDYGLSNFVNSSLIPIPYVGRVANTYAPKIFSNPALQRNIAKITKDSWDSYNPLRDPSMIGRFAYQQGGYVNPYDKRDKALRNNGIPTLPQIGLQRNFFPMKFQEGGDKSFDFGPIGGIIGSITDIISTMKAEDMRQDYFHKSNEDLERYIPEAKKRLQQIANNSALFNVANYATQDPSYTYLDLSSQRAASDSSYARQLAANQNNRNLAFASGQAPITSFMRNAGSLGLNPTLAANMAGRMQAQGLNNANQVGLQYNNMENNIMRNQLASDMNIYDRLSADRQFGRASIRNNINNLNAGLMNNMKGDSIGYLKSVDDLDRFNLATRMALRNQNMAAQIGNTFALGDSIAQGFDSGYRAYQDYRQRRPRRTYSNTNYGYDYYRSGTPDGWNGQYYEVPMNLSNQMSYPEWNGSHYTIPDMGGGRSYPPQ